MEPPRAIDNGQSRHLCANVMLPSSFSQDGDVSVNLRPQSHCRQLANGAVDINRWQRDAFRRNRDGGSKRFWKRPNKPRLQASTQTSGDIVINESNTLIRGPARTADNGRNGHINI